MEMYITVEDKCYLVRVKFARESSGVVETVQDMLPVSYTHLTLPTILLV